MEKLVDGFYFLQNYDFVTVHVAGKNHCGPDALSRMHEKPINSNICHIKMNGSYLKTLSDDMNMHDWMNEINEDITFKKLIENSKIILKDNVYVKEDSKNVVVVPKSARWEIMSILHDNYGHPGINKLLYKVKERYY